MGGSDEAKFDHPTQKAVELMRRPILNHTSMGGVIYDPFLGSGTTLIAAELCDRVCVGMDIDPAYVDLIVTRWQKQTGSVAKLETSGATFEEVRTERGDSAGEVR